MSRFNLWEKLIKENEEVDQEIDAELEGEIETEEDETTQDMLINFVMALPEDSVPEDLRSTYDALMAKIGDEYLGTSDEEEEEMSDDDLDSPKFDMEDEESEDEDEEMKEAKERASYGVVLPSGTKIQVEDAAEQKRAKKAVDTYVKMNSGAGDKALMKLAAMAILMKGETVKDVIKAYEAATSEKFKDYVKAVKG